MLSLCWRRSYLSYIRHTLSITLLIFEIQHLPSEDKDHWNSFQFLQQSRLQPSSLRANKLGCAWLTGDTDRRGHSSTCPPDCSISQHRHTETGQRFHWPDYLFLQNRWQLKCLAASAFQLCLLLKAGFSLKLGDSKLCTFMAPSSPEKDAVWPPGCSALPMHLSPSHHLPANLSGGFCNTLRKQKTARHIDCMLCLHPEKLSQKLLTPFHVSFCMQPQISHWA